MTMVDGRGIGGDAADALTGMSTTERLTALAASLGWYDVLYDIEDEVLRIAPVDQVDVKKLQVEEAERIWSEVVALFRERRIEPALSFRAVDTFAPRTIADRLGALVRSLESYDLLSNGVRDEILAILPGDEAAIAALDDDRISETWHRVVNVFRRRRLEPVLILHGLPYPRYPVGTDRQAAPVPPVAMWDPPRLAGVASGGWQVLGREIGFPIGIPSCDLTATADWIEYYARKGFHVLTYRTVRSVPRLSAEQDWVFLDGIQRFWDPGSAGHRDRQVRHAEGPTPPDQRRISTATSYDAPCPEPEVWQADVADARRRLDALGGHHLLIVSVTDSVPKHLKSAKTLSADFVDVARRAEAAGAHAIECYLARASVTDSAGQLKRCERNVETSITIVRAVRAALKPTTKLLIKLSAELEDASLEDIVLTLARDKQIDGVSGISPVEVERVTTGTDERSLWEDDRRPAVAGYAIRSLSQNFVKRLAAIRAKHNLDFDIIAMGGVMTPEDVAIYMGLGASAVQTATAAVCDPDLAESAAAWYRTCVPTTTELWDGVVVTVDADAGIFWARVTTRDKVTPDMDAQFELGEVHHDQRSEVRPGAFFQWATGLVDDGSRLVRQSAVRFRQLDPPSKEATEAGRILADRAAAAFGPMPDVG
jgi:dihydropyrimidine dehydrogenase (NAD+) subunit PreA